MNTFIAILRGINVSGAKPIKMDDLRKTFKSLGFEKVTTYIQSGNVVFTATESPASVLARKIEDKISKDYGFDVPVIVLTYKELQNLFFNNPLNDGTRETEFLHITVLSELPDDYNLKEIELKKQGNEEIVILERFVYLYCPHGYGKTKLNNNFLESKLKVAATTRNWKTAGELLKIAKNTEV